VENRLQAAWDRRTQSFFITPSKAATVQPLGTPGRNAGGGTPAALNRPAQQLLE
jgi:hypothetical protein